MSGIKEFRANGSFKLIVAELPGGDVGLTRVDGRVQRQQIAFALRRETELAPG